MFFFTPVPIMTCNWILILAAVIPAVILMVKVYKSDRIEKESSRLLWSLITGGILSTLLAMVEERLGEFIILRFTQEGSTLYNVLLYFGVVAFAEESSKYIFLKKRTWNNEEFNCQYDGVVYAVFTALGFALWENINYVLSYGFLTALVRAVTAIPGHACFGVFMGIFYGAARKYENKGYGTESKILRIAAVIVPALFHGAYDYIATLENNGSNALFAVFIIILFAAAFISINKSSKLDQRI